MHTSEETQPTPTQVLTHSNPTPELASVQEKEQMNQKFETTLAQTTLIPKPSWRRRRLGKGTQTKSFKINPSEQTWSLQL